MARRARNTPQTYSNQPAPQSRSAGSVPSHIQGPRILLLLSVFALLLIGLVMVYSAGSIEAISEGDSPASFLVRQLGFAVFGCVGAVFIWKFIPYHVWMGKLLWAAWILAVLLLLLTAVMGTVGLGAQRWLIIGPVRIQPSEFAKIVFVLMMARILFDFRNGELDVRNLFVQVALLIVVPLFIIYRTQSDLGTTIICFVGILTVLWVGEVPLRTILLLVIGGLAFAALASMVGYRQDRFVFLNPWDDGEGGFGNGYQLIHSFYAFSEGGLFGVGLGNSREKFLYLPEAETDFIFSIIGEELGLIGAAAVIALFLLFLYAGIRIAQAAPDNFGTMIAGSITIMVVFQAFLNIGCVLGLLPTTGKPLPFISSGGSSLVACLFMVGLILSVSQHSDVPSVYERRRDDLRVVRSTSPSAPSPSRGSSRGQGAVPRRGSGQTGSRSRSGSSNSRSRR
ncbi:FtsW/RodA/SpoVE family cell cycle protein [Raoultibacter phocaeensis]|uniref:FtsW/RodA/SpoVE family cell cycle protein n=1 Tax=Raoultibacter phocaeensis TaxID=2479841 RepID=UPI001119ABD7|nr:FtsW/RodA/SpoVE family cell cycle protein [Raoultibacter phocaeensis]